MNYKLLAYTTTGWSENTIWIIKNVILFTTVVVLLPVGLFAQQSKNTQKALVFTHVAVIDCTGAPIQSDMTVVVKGERIVALAQTGELAVPQDAQVIDATGKFLIPGLWDMHVHLWIGKRYLPLFTANGITGVRVMWGRPEYHKWRKEIEAGQIIGPRMVIASPIVGHGPNHFPEGDKEEEGRKIVRKVKKEGADFIKVYNYIPRDAYFAIADEAKKQGIPFAGHVPYSVSAVEASDAGQQSIEHGHGFCQRAPIEKKNAERNSSKPGPLGVSA
jgi:imidazolonepropionase-like amidohydrolase